MSSKDFMPLPAPAYLLRGNELMAVMEGAATPGSRQQEFRDRLRLHDAAVDVELASTGKEIDRLKRVIDDLTAETKSPAFGEHDKSWQKRVQKQLQKAKEQLGKLENEHHGTAAERAAREESVKNARNGRHERVYVVNIGGKTYREVYAVSDGGDSELLLKREEISELAANVTPGSAQEFAAPVPYFE